MLVSEYDHNFLQDNDDNDDNDNEDAICVNYKETD